jgi:hypothetical protein
MLMNRVEPKVKTVKLKGIKEMAIELVQRAPGGKS